MSDNIKVVVKVRPLISRELDEKLSLQWRVKNNTLYQLDQSGKEYGSGYTFDKVYDQNTKTSDVFDDIAKPIVEAAIAGINGTIFAYGQTSSGKTYTMTGTDEDPGIIKLAIYKLFDIIKTQEDRDFLLRVSYIEIYNEQIIDLLLNNNVEKKKIKIHEGLQGIKVDATEKVTSTPEEVIDVMKEGETNRQTGATNMNEQSSRSHSIFQITIESREHTDGNVENGCVNVSTLNLVDLAGSERSGQTGATGIRFKEGTHINKSLSVLALVIKQLSEDRKKYVNYRDSKLTRILQNSLGGNAKTSIVCAVTPAAIEETVSTLHVTTNESVINLARKEISTDNDQNYDHHGIEHLPSEQRDLIQFANRAKAIENKPEVNAVATNATMIQQLTKKLSSLQSQLQVKENLEQDNRKLQEKIKSLQRQIINGFGSQVPAPRTDRRQTWCAPRRMTIDSLHTIQEDREPSVTRFCTPALKYNLALTDEFRPITVNRTTMPRVSENTPSGHVTPPLIYTKKSVNFTDEVIDLDSDDDSTPSDNVPCSPYHKCYESSKTPPCILREKAKKAEENYKEIIDLTDREKIYPPPAEELLKKLDENTNVITKLEDQVENLNKKCADRDTDIIALKEKIKKSEEELNLVNEEKVKLDRAHQETKLKLTDLEVSLETLKKKYLSREEELLSLLEEKSVVFLKRHDQSVNKLSEKSIDFMNLSKDISLVHSDTDNSIVNPNDDQTSIQKLVKEQISSKNNVIQELETNLHDEKQNISNLEMSNNDIQDLVNSLNGKVNAIELENSMLKCNVYQLHTIIETQKQSLENSSRDIESYNNLIKELQIKLNMKNEILNIDDIDLEDMISKEKELIANNENLRNIIHSLQNAINERNKKISVMKTEYGDSNMAQIEDLNNERTNLAHDVEELKEKLKDKNNEITRLTKESETLLATNKEIVIKLEKLQKENELLIQQNQDNLSKINNINSYNEEQLVKKNTENDEISKQLNDLKLTIIHLQEDIAHKEDFISSLTNDNKQQNEYFVSECISLTDKVKSLLSKLGKDDMDEIIPNNIQCIFVYLNNCLDHFEKIILENVSLKKRSLIINTENEIILEKLNKDISTYKADICNKSTFIENLTQQNKTLLLNIDNIRGELENKNKVSQELENQLHYSAKVYEKIAQTVTEKENQITMLNEKQSALMFEIEELKTYIKAKEETFADFKTEIEFQNANYLSKFNSENKDRILSGLINVLHHADISIPEKYSEVLKHTQIVIESLNQKQGLLKSIFMKVADLAQVSDSVYDKAFFETENEAYDQIPDILDEIKAQKDIVKINEGKSYDDFLEAQNRIHGLVKNNQKLKSDIDANKQQNKIFAESIDSIEEENKQLNNSLAECNDLINSLQEEIIAKSNQINTLDLNTKEVNCLIDIDNTIAEKKAMKNIEILIKCKESELLSTKSCNKSLIEDSETWNTRTQIPPTLSSICFSAVMEALSCSISSNSSPPTTTNSQLTFSDETNVTLEAELKQIRKENKILKENLNVLKLANKKLIDEQSAIRKEVMLLAKPAMDLQKKIFKHRTNLNTLTATTYAENKALHSRVKVLHHHHSRCLNVCQKDIPQLKHELMVLYNLLKTDTQLERYSWLDVTDSKNNTFKNDSTLDADLLMLDTNVTLATIADNTLVEHDQTRDITQVNLDIEPQHVTLETSKQNQTLASTGGYGILQDENVLFMQQNQHFVHAHSSPIKYRNEFHNKSVQVTEDIDCANCIDKNEILINIETLTRRLSLLTKEKSEIEDKYNNLKLEVPSTEALIRKLNTLEKEFEQKQTQCKQLQEENDILSTQVIENISDADNLKKELDDLKIQTKLLLEKTGDIQQYNRSFVDDTSETCLQCIAKDKLISKQLFESKSLINRSQRDIHSSLRHSKICTLQNELHASKEDCKKISKEFGTIKNQLEKSNLSMNQSVNESKLSMIEDGITETSIFDENNTQTTSNLIFNIPNRSEERTQDIYAVEKLECFDYFVEKTGAEKENLNYDLKIIDVMKMLYNSLIIKHGNEVENLINKLKDFEESNNLLQFEVDNISAKYESIRKEIEDKMCSVRNNLNAIEDNLNKIPDSEKCFKMTAVFKEQFLKMLDAEFSLTSQPVFDLIIDGIVLKHQSDLNQTIEQYNKLKQHMEGLMSELTSVNESLIQMRSQLSEKETECNLLKIQKERINEISNAVTLDIKKKEQELRDTITHGCQIILENNLMEKSEVEFSLNLNANLKVLFEKLVKKCQDEIQKTNEQENLILEITNIKALLQEKEKQLKTLLMQNEKLKEINSAVTIDIVQKENDWQKQKYLHADHVKKYEEVLAEYNNNINVIKNMNQEMHNLKEALAKKETLETALNSDLVKLLDKINGFETEIAHLKIVNDAIINEKEIISEELTKSVEIIQNKNDIINKMHAEIRSLQEKVTQTNFLDYNMLKEEIANLRIKITETEEKYENKSRDCSRLEMNIKTHEKSVQIQSNIVKRLQKQKDDDNKKISELSEKCKYLDAMKLQLATSKEEVESLRTAKNSLEVRISELEIELGNLQKEGDYLEAIKANSRRRRQSLHDSKRQFADDIADSEDHNKMEVVFDSRSKPDDLFTDNDENSSNRSTPSRNNSGKRRDSLFGRDQSDKEDESRSSSVAASRLRRQSIHDLHRSILTHTVSPTASSASVQLQEKLSQSGDEPVNYSDYAILKATLTTCQLELEELKERYKEVDEECEICAQYLHERDEQCLRLKKEKSSLEETLAELRKTLEENNSNTTKNDESKRSYATAAVNTDEDWANLHSVVVDRMSFDAEVEKNKKLTRAVEEFHLKNRDLKCTIAKMQKAIEKYSARDNSAAAKELDTTKKQLKAHQQELEELRQKYKELDEECGTCAEYLRERDEQCHKLKTANATLKAKLEDLKEKVSGPCASRKKRQSIHDQHREPSSDFVDATTETSDDLLSYQVERDNTSKSTKEEYIREIKRLTALVEKLSHHKMTLEQQLAQLTAAQMPLYVATGSAIVQNQQMTDIMKENQKLKKINAKLVHICKKRSKSQSDANRENENITEQG